jgi:hypothetical protein
MTTTLRRTITALSLILISFTAFAQQAERQIKGKLVDETNTPVDYATISVVNAADSLLEKSTVSAKNGAFEINDCIAAGFKKLCTGI